MKKRAVKLLPVFLMAVLLSGCVEAPVVGQGVAGKKKQPVFGRHTVGQNFEVYDRNLTRVDVFLYPPRAFRGRPVLPKESGARTRLADKKVVMRLYSWPDRREVAVAERPVSKMNRAAMRTFYFDPIPESKKRSYYFEISAPGLTEDLAIRVGLRYGDLYRRGTAYIDSRPAAGGDIQFMPYIRMTPRMLLNSIGSRLLADPAFIAVWLLLVLATAAATALAWRKPVVQR